MTTYLTPAQEFETPAEALAHYGVKGMKWGVRNDGSVARSSPTSRDILNARAKVASQQRQINTQIDKANLASGRQQKTEVKKLSEMSTKLLKDPDRATALRLTTGEKWAAAGLVVALPGVGTAGSAGFVGTRIAARKSIERQQRKLS